MAKASVAELYVPPDRLAAFMEAARTLLRRRNAHVIYGTVRLIERDDETMLCWARERFACIVLNLHVEHTLGAVAYTAETFRALIDLAIAENGSYYLTYHRWARRDQVEPAHEGRGIVGMRERVAMLRGTFQAEPTSHGFRVSARLPVEPGTAA